MSYDPLLAVLGLSQTNPSIFSPTATKVGVAVAPAALPSAPISGGLVIDSGDSNKLKWWDGSAWQTAGGGGGGGSIGGSITSGQVAFGDTTANTIKGVAAFSFAGSTLSVPQVILSAATSVLSSLRIPSGADVTSPVDGDFWATSTGIVCKFGTSTTQLNMNGASGGLSAPVITVTGGGATINVASIQATLYPSTGYAGGSRTYDLGAQVGLVLVDNSQNFVIANYNSGSPVIQVSQNPAVFNGSTIVGLASMYRIGSRVHSIPVDWGLSTAGRLNERAINLERFTRWNGLALSASGLTFTATAGNVYYGCTLFSLAQAVSTDITNNVERWVHTAGVWGSTDVNAADNSYYDDGTNAVLLNGPGTKYAVNWVYRYIDGSGIPKMAIILGTGNYTQAQAISSSIPASVPPVLIYQAILIGRIIVAKGASSVYQIDSAFTQTFASSNVVDHNSLANLQGGTTNEYYHLTSAQAAGTWALPLTISYSETTLLGTKGVTVNVTSTAATTGAHAIAGNFTANVSGTSNNGDVQGIYAASNYTLIVGGSGSVIGGIFAPTALASAGAGSYTASIQGVLVQPTASISGAGTPALTVSELTGVDIQPSTGFAAGTVTVTTLHGVWIHSNTNTTATTTIGTYYGLKLDAQTTPVPTNNWGIYQDDTGAKNFFSGKTTIDYGASSGTIPAVATNANLRIANVDGTASFISGIGVAATGFQLNGYRSGGARTGLTGASGNVIQLNAYAYDGTNFGSNPIGQFTISCNGTMSGTNKGSSHVWSGIQFNTVTAPVTWMTLSANASEPANCGALCIGVSLTSGYGLIQLPVGTTQPYGIVFGVDTPVYRSGVSTLTIGGTLYVSALSSNGTVSTGDTVSVSTVPTATVGSAYGISVSVVPQPATTSSCIYTGVSSKVQNLTTVAARMASASISSYVAEADFIVAATANGSLYALTGYSATLNINNTGPSGRTATVTTAYGLNLNFVMTASDPGATSTIGTLYGVYIGPAALSGSGTLVITNRYGIYQADTLASNYFAGSVTSASFVLTGNYFVTNTPQSLTASGTISSGRVKFTGSTASQTLTLPVGVDGTDIFVRNAATVSVTVAAHSGGNTIEGASNYVVMPGEAISLTFISGDWTIF